MRITQALIEQVANALASLKMQWPTAGPQNIVTIISKPLWDAVTEEFKANKYLFPNGVPSSPEGITLHGSPIHVKEGRGHWSFSHAFPFLLSSSSSQPSKTP